MADAADSKSVALKSVRVQVPPPAHAESPVNQRSQGFLFTPVKPKYHNRPAIGFFTAVDTGRIHT